MAKRPHFFATPGTKIEVQGAVDQENGMEDRHKRRGLQL
jgi:hypothetical protein